MLQDTVPWRLVLYCIDNGLPNPDILIIKYQPVTDILNPLGFGVKVSFTILNIFGVARTIGL